MTDSKDTIGSTNLRVRVDPRKCVSNGKCTYAAPGIYVIDEETGVAYIEDEDRATAEFILAGARACPTNAIIVEQYNRRIYPLVLETLPGEPQTPGDI